MRLRECLNDVLIFNMDTHVMSSVKTIGDYVTPRRFHTASVIFNKFFIIYGGIASNEHELKDIVLLNLGINYNNYYFFLSRDECLEIL